MNTKILTNDEQELLDRLIARGVLVASIDEDGHGFHRVNMMRPSMSGGYVIAWLDPEPEPQKYWGMLDDAPAALCEVADAE